MSDILFHTRKVIIAALTAVSVAASAAAQQPAIQNQPASPRNPAGRNDVPAGTKVLRDLEYAKVGDNALLLDLYLPEKGQGPFPLIVAIHGGGWANGSKAGAHGRGQAARGYAVASIGYRLSGEAIFPAQIQDVKAAVRWLRANARKYDLNTDRIAATGHSAGGHLASLLGTSAGVKEFDVGDHLEFSSDIQAVCALSGPTDFLQMDAHAIRKSNHDAANSPESRLIGGAIQDNKDKVARTNPITFVSEKSPPFLLIHGADDPTVPPHQAELLKEALEKASVDVQLHLIAGGGHGIGGPEVARLTDAFFDKQLKRP